MTTATVTSKGQISIPKDVRIRLGIGVGDRAEFVEIQGGVFQLIAATQDVQALKGIVRKSKKPITLEQMNQAAAEIGAAD